MTEINKSALPTPARRIRVMIVDDSAVIRAVITRTLQVCADIEVVGVAFNGEMAIRTVKQLNPDIVLLDIEMPVMDGITALPQILKEKPGVRVVICSTLSARGADISIKALALGATECLLKPGGESISSAQDFQRDLIQLIRTLGARLVLRPEVVREGTAPDTAKITLKSGKPILPPEVLAIGSSTGGPKALMDVLKDLSGLPIPIVITQHMPKTFTALLAKHIEQHCNIPTYEGAENMVIKKGCAYIAPGGYHMTFKKSGSETAIHITEDWPENFCRPSVNPMLRGLQAIYGARILTVILTGMGSDGSQVCIELAKQGAQVIAQDEATSVVWGMPGAVANAGICSAVLPLNQISSWIRTAIK